MIAQHVSNRKEKLINDVITMRCNFALHKMPFIDGFYFMNLILEIVSLSYIFIKPFSADQVKLIF